MSFKLPGQRIASGPTGNSGGFAAAALVSLLLLCLASVDSHAAGTLQAIDPPQPAAAFALPAVDGRSHQLQDYRGRVVVVSFWATWCGACIREMPALQRAAADWSALGIETLLINFGDDMESVQTFRSNTGLTLNTLIDSEQQLATPWQVNALPLAFVIDRQLRIRYRAVGALDWESAPIRHQLLQLSREPDPATP